MNSLRYENIECENNVRIMNIELYVLNMNIQRCTECT